MAFYALSQKSTETPIVLGKQEGQFSQEINRVHSTKQDIWVVKNCVYLYWTINFVFWLTFCPDPANKVQIE